MKKIFVFILAAICAISLFGCADNNENDTVNIYLPDGAPALSLVSVFDKTEFNGQKVNFTVVPSANIGMYVKNKQADLAIVPTNMAAILYNQDSSYKYVSANTHGNLFIVGFNEATSLTDLVGKVVGVIGQGQVPDLVFQTLLKEEGVEFVQGDTPTDGKVTLYYANDGGVLLPMIKQKKVDFGLLGEPAVTTALSNLEGLKVVFDVQELWGDGFPQAGMIASDEVSDAFIKAMFDALEESKDFAENNPSEALSRITSHMIDGSETTIKALTADTVKRSNVKLVKAEDCKEAVNKFLGAFYELNAQSIGGKLPDENFFRTVK